MKELSNLIARQPICNKQLKVKAFELLYRMQMTSEGAPLLDNPAGATIDVLLAAFNDLCIQDVVGDKLAFINFTSNIILKQIPPISHKQLVIELLEDQEITPSLLKAIARLRQKGYKIALDDFCLTKETISLIEYADIIKIDVLDTPPSVWEDYIPKLKEKGITLLAEKVETQEMFEQCCDLGFDLFQGYFFAKPKIIVGRRISNNELSILELITKLSATDIDIEDVTNTIIQDPNLTYNLLRTINSGLFGLPKEIGSIKHAITLLGLKKLKKWISLLALTTLENKPQLLIELAMVRAKMCEILGQKTTARESADDYFTVGLLSLMDAFVDLNMGDLLDKISLPQKMEDALLHHKGDMGKVLSCVINYQRGNWGNTENISFFENNNIESKDITQAYLDSVQWAENNKDL